MKKILIVGPAWVGDMVMSQVIYAGLRARYPDACLDVLAPAATLKLVQRMPEVNRGILLKQEHGQLGLGYRLGLGKQLAAYGYDWAIITPNSLKSALVPCFAGIPRRTGFLGEYRYYLLNDIKLLDKNRLPKMTDRFLALINQTSDQLIKPRLMVDAQNQARFLNEELPGFTLPTAAPFTSALSTHSSSLQSPDPASGLSAPKVQPAGLMQSGHRESSPGESSQVTSSGESSQETSTEIAASESQVNRQPPIIGFCPGAEFGDAKKWPEQHFAELGRQLVQQGKHVWIFGSPAEASIGQAISEAIGQGATNLAGKTSLLDAIDLLALCQQVITNDSGLMHVAAATGRPVIALYGSTSPDFTPPLADNARILRQDLDCSPCFKRNCPLGHKHCLTQLHPGQVLAEMSSHV